MADDDGNFEGTPVVDPPDYVDERSSAVTTTIVGAPQTIVRRSHVDRGTRGLLYLVVTLVVVGVVALVVALAALDLYFWPKRRVWLHARHHHHPNETDHRLLPQRLPAILHQTWKTRDLLPFQVVNREAWHRALTAADPHFDCRLYVDTDFDPWVHAHFEWFWPTWQRLTPFIKRVDAIRYMWLFHYGGVYADLDLQLRDPAALARLVLAPYPLCTLVVSSPSSHTALLFTGPPLLLAHAGHDLFMDMLHHIAAHPDLPVLDCTGPKGLSRVLRAYLRRRERANHVLLLSSTYCGMGGDALLKLHPRQRLTVHTNSATWK
jgi:hypothetical protein